jgi:hypothetical protein
MKVTEPLVEAGDADNRIRSHGHFHSTTPVRVQPVLDEQ